MNPIFQQLMQQIAARGGGQQVTPFGAPDGEVPADDEPPTVSAGLNTQQQAGLRPMQPQQPFDRNMLAQFMNAGGQMDEEALKTLGGRGLFGMMG